MARTSRRRHREREFHRIGDISSINAAVEKLKEKGEEVLNAGKQALAEGVNRIVEDAKSRCHVRTGKLRESIQAKKLADGAAYEITADAKNSSGVAYGQFVEFSPAINHPFLYPAIDANIENVKNNVDNAINNAINRRN